MNIILIGFKASGKSTVGQELARHLALTFIDLDRVIEQLARDEDGLDLSYRKLFEQRGEAFFRQLESRALDSLADRQGIVLATGGGAPMTCENHRRLAEIGKLVYLRVKPVVIFRRLERLGMPATLGNAPTLAQLVEQWRAPDAVNWEIADLTIEASDLRPEEIAAEIIRQLEV